MNIPIHQQPSPWRYLWLVALIGLPALGWYGILDEFSSKGINDSIANAGLIYGTARGINALVSVLQGTELHFLVITISIGEVLDPLNDLVERFSDFVLFALGSLALQKILLAIVTERVFNILLTAIALITSLSIAAGNRKLLSVLLRTFLVIAFFRFSLGLVVLANSWVDATFLDEADQQRHAAMEGFQGELRQIDTLSRMATEAARTLTDAQSELAKLQEDKDQQKQSIDTLNTTIEGLDHQLNVESNKAGKLCALFIHGPVLSPTCPESVEKLSIKLDQYRSQKDGMLSNLKKIDADITELKDKIECLKKRVNGEKCHFWEVLPDVPDLADIQSKIDQIEDRVGEFTQNTINLLVSLLLKSIAIPILFFYILLKIVRVNWDRI